VALDSKKEPVLFSARMEEALCRLLSDDGLQIRLALNLYQGITKDLDAYPAGWFRLGQACARVAEDAPPASKEANEATKEGYEAYEAARQRLQRLGNIENEDRYLRISPAQEAYIRGNLARLQGFILWRNSDRRRQVEPISPGDALDVAEAFRVTERGLEEALTTEDRGKLANNATFYFVEAMEISKSLNVPLKPALDRKSFGKTLASLEKDFATTDSKDILVWDTILRAREFLGDSDGARRAATKVLDANSERSTEAPMKAESAYEREMYGRAVQYAWKVVREVVA
jgi:hypothetical protein